MKFKKIFMIIILIIFIFGIGFVVFKVNKASENKTAEKQNNTSNINTNTTTNTASGKVRKSSEKAKADINNMVEITDNYFIEQTNDVYVNLNDYIGKTIKIEGLIYSYQDTNGDKCYAVVRNTPGCCGNDGLAGLDIRYDEEYPELNTWVEVIGVIETDLMDGGKIPAIHVSSMTQKEEGTTFVTN